MMQIRKHKFPDGRVLTAELFEHDSASRNNGCHCVMSMDIPNSDRYMWSFDAADSVQADRFFKEVFGFAEWNGGE